jgi:hypothetical protein
VSSSLRPEAASRVDHPSGRRVDVDRILVELERSGGFAGLTARWRLDTSDLTDDEARSVARAVDALEAAGAEGEPPPVPDARRYEFVVSRRGGSRRLVFGDTTLPADSRPLVDLLQRRGAR